MRARRHSLILYSMLFYTLFCVISSVSFEVLTFWHYGRYCKDCLSCPISDYGAQQAVFRRALWEIPLILKLIGATMLIGRTRRPVAGGLWPERRKMVFMVGMPLCLGSLGLLSPLPFPLGLRFCCFRPICRCLPKLPLTPILGLYSSLGRMNRL